MAVGSGFSQDDLSQIVPLLGVEAQPVHMPFGSPAGVGGGDVDCLVWGLDESWPLRLPSGWRLLQILQYDTVAWYWIVERDREVIAVDTLADPYGIGQYAWPVHASTLPLSAGRRAAYLTTKRLRKNIRREDEWARIAALAREDPGAFRASLVDPFGGLAGRVADEVLAGGRPDACFDRARRGLKWRRVRTPDRAVRLAVLQTKRAVGRWMHPTGLSLLLVGPDGTGKSSVAAATLEACAPMFRRTEARHWRPGLLPRSDELTGGEQRDTADPHGAPSRGPAASLAAAAYHWLDFSAAGLTVDRFRRVRSTLLCAERGWEDLGTDPRRYRLRIPPAVVRAAGRTLPRPDVAIVLRASPAVAAARKPELPLEEIGRQASYWERHPPRARAVVTLDADRSLDEVVRDVRDLVADALNRRALARVGSGWAALPRRAAPRWWIPRSPTRAAAAGLAVYQPVTGRGRAGWKAARAAARLGAFAAWRRGPGIPEEARTMLAPHLPPGGTLSLMRANHPGRYVALVASRSGEPLSVAKVALDDAGRAALEREADALEGVARSLPPPLGAPDLLVRSPGVCVTRSVRWSPRADPWRLDPGVAGALGRWFASGEGDGRGPAHGDCAPWNLLRTATGWVLVDWEVAGPSGEAFHDPFHYLVQAHALLGRPARRELLEGIEGRGEVGAALAAFATGAGIETTGVTSAFAAYLRTSSARIDPKTPDGAAGAAARARLLESLPAQTGYGRPATSP